MTEYKDDKDCPVCEKQGKNSKLKFFNINFKESVLLCANPSCPYPFGYENFKYLKDGVEFEEATPNPIVVDIQLISEEEKEPFNPNVTNVTSNEIVKNTKIIESSEITKTINQVNSQLQSLKSINKSDKNEILDTSNEDAFNRYKQNVEKLSESHKIVRSYRLYELFSKLQSKENITTSSSLNTCEVQNKNERIKTVTNVPNLNTIKPSIEIEEVLDSSASRFPKFSFDNTDIEKLNDESKSDPSSNTTPTSTVFVENKTDKDKSTDAALTDDICINDLNEFFESICSQPISTNENLSDEFFKDLFGI